MHLFNILRTSFNSLRRPAVLIFFLAYIVRLLMNDALMRHYFFYFNPSSDVIYYDNWARDIVYHNWIGRDVFWGMPLYPYFLAILYSITFSNPYLIRIIHILIGAVNCSLTYLVASKIFDKKVGVVAGVLVATNFTLICYDCLMMPVGLNIFLSLSIIYFFLHREQMKKKREWFFLGIIIGLSALGDGKMLLFSLGIIAYFFVVYRHKLQKYVLRALIPLGLGIFIILSGVGLRNKLIGGDWIWISAQSGLSFFVGNNPDANGVFSNPSFIRPDHRGQDEDQKIIASKYAGRSLRPSEVSYFWFKKGINYILSSPISYSRLLLKKFLLFFTDTEDAYDMDMLFLRDWKNMLDINPFSIICYLAILGILFMRKKYKESIFINIMILSQLVFTLIFFLTNKHRASILPFLIMYETCALFWLVEQIRERRLLRITCVVMSFFVFVLIFKPKQVASNMIDFLKNSKECVVYGRRNNYKKAVEACKKALAIRPYDTNTLYNLANIYLFNNEFIKARQYYKRVLNINPYQVDAMYNLAYIYKQKADYDRALQLYKYILTLRESIDVHYQMASIYHIMGKCDKAKEHYLRIQELAPQLAKNIGIRQAIAVCK